MPSSSNELGRKQTAEVEDEAIQRPVDAKVIFLGGIFLILFLAALYAVPIHDPLYIVSIKRVAGQSGTHCLFQLYSFI